jgi:uncharacterized protein (DUF488 family)
MSLIVYTLGHSNHALAAYITLLKRHGVDAVADVRSQPYSRFHPQFNREPLKAELKMNGIAYVFLGRELGARSQDPACYENGKVQYGRLARTPQFREGLERVRTGAATKRIALLCAEKDPLQCHRTILVSRHLAEQGVAVRHILADGGGETHPEALQRLKRQLGIPESDLFRSAAELDEEAYERQGERIAYAEVQAEDQPRATALRAAS